MEFEIRFDPSGRRVRVSEGTRLIDAIHSAGLPLAEACEAEGLCARCGVEVLDGAPDLPPESAEEADAKRRNRVNARLRLACRVVPRSDLVVTTPYW